MHIHDDIKIILNASRRNPLLKPKEERDLAKRIFTSRIDVWEHSLSYAPLCAAMLDFVEPLLLKLLERMKKPLDLAKLEACRVAANDIRERGTTRNKKNFDRACKEAAEAVSEIDASLKVFGAAQDLMRKPKPFGMSTPPKGSGKFSAYLQALDAEMGAHRALKEKFWLANIRLAVGLTKKYDYGMVPFADLMQEALLGLMTAVERFDHRKGFKFSTYGTWWVRHALNRYTANHGRTIRWPAHVVADFETLRRAHNKLFAIGEPTDIESLSRVSQIKPKRVEAILSLTTINPLSLDMPIGFDTQETLRDRLSDGALDIPDESPHLDPQFKRIRSKVNRLPGIEGDVIIKRFGLDGQEPRTLQAIAEEHALSRERIRQLQERGLDRLRGYVRA